jgi:hypothetical protein
MKLKTVTVTFEYVIVVDDNDADYAMVDSIAREHFRDACRDLSAYEVEYDITDYSENPATDWDGMCIPYGSENDKRIKDYE